MMRGYDMYMMRQYVYFRNNMIQYVIDT